jgi:Ca2+-binding EF-hand superfamily protein
MSNAWDSQVDAMADTIEGMVRSGKGEVSEFRSTANDTISKVGASLPENVRNALHERLNARLDKLEAEVNAKIDNVASTVSDVSHHAIDGAMMQFIETMKGLPVEELTNLFSFIDKDGNGTINQEEFHQFVSTTLPPGTVIPPASIAIGFQVLDSDRSGSLSLSDILGTKGEIITSTAKIVSEEMKQEPEIPEIEEVPVEEVPVEEVPVEEVPEEETQHEAPEKDESANAIILDSETITSKLSEARFTSEKNKIIDSIKGNSVEFEATINRIRSMATSTRPMEVEISGPDGSDYIMSIDTSKVSEIPNNVENGKGVISIKGTIQGFNMARNCVVLDISNFQ